MDEYQNVSTGLLEEPEHISRVYMTRESRYLAEALLTDPQAPFKVYTDLFGWANPDDPELYRKYFFDIPKNISRMDLVRFITGLPRSTDGDIFRYDLFKKIFDQGWEVIDERYNKSSNIEIRQLTHKYLRKLFTGTVPELVNSAIKSKSDAEMFQKAFKAMKDATSLELAILRAEKELSSRHEQLQLSFVTEVQTEGQKSKDIAAKIYGMTFDELCNLQKPEDTLNNVEDTDLQTVLTDFQEAEIIDNKAVETHSGEKKN